MALLSKGLCGTALQPHRKQEDGSIVGLRCVLIVPQGLLVGSWRLCLSIQLSALGISPGLRERWEPTVTCTSCKHRKQFLQPCAASSARLGSRYGEPSANIKALRVDGIPTHTALHGAPRALGTSSSSSSQRAFFLGAGGSAWDRQRVQHQDLAQLLARKHPRRAFKSSRPFLLGKESKSDGRRTVKTESRPPSRCHRRDKH